MSGKSCGWSSGAAAAMELGLGGVDWRRKRDPGASQFAAEDPQISSMSRCLEGEKMGSVIMAREQAALWKTRDNGGKAAWLFIGVLSSVYWISDVITDDELAVLIIRACSSRNLFIKHHIVHIKAYWLHISTVTYFALKKHNLRNLINFFLWIRYSVFCLFVLRQWSQWGLMLF